MAQPTTIDERPPTESRARTGPAAGARSSPGPASARYYVCLALLAISALSMQVVANWLGGYFRKHAVPLKLPLAQMDRRVLLPAYDLHLQPPQPLSEDVIETLGTDEYLNWIVVDRARERSDPLCVAHVFISYYTGKPDQVQVPHVPEECLVAGGFQRAGTARTVEIPVPGVGAPGDKVPVRVLEFDVRASPLGRGKGGRSTFDIFYFFLCNWDFMTTRNEVRVAQANLFEKYAYYAKVEIRFTDYAFRQFAGQEESIEALEPLLGQILPVLLRDHIPAKDELEP
jgi:hypothetical protein